MHRRSFLVIAIATAACGRAPKRQTSPARQCVPDLMATAVSESDLRPPPSPERDALRFAAFVAAHGTEFVQAFEHGDCPEVNRLLEEFRSPTSAQIPVPPNASAEDRAVTESLGERFAVLYDAAGCALACTAMRIVEIEAGAVTVFGAVRGLTDRPCFGLLPADRRVIAAHVTIRALRSRGFRVALAPEMPDPSNFIHRTYDPDIEEDAMEVRIPGEYLPLYLPVVVEPIPGTAVAPPTAEQPFRFRLTVSAVFAAESRSL